MKQDALIWLQSWLAKRVNGDWEHRYGVKIESLDNPGWSVVIDLAETPIESKPFDRIQYEDSESDWMTCRVNDQKFEAFGDIDKLTRILETFKSWASDETCSLNARGGSHGSDE